MAVRDHIAAMTPSWWRQPARPSPYSPRLLDLILRSAPAAGIEAPVGVYACVTGPCYETPAEIRALRAIGADAVGMSTVHEANVAAELGMEVAAISYVANRAAGLSPTPLSHIDVLQTVTAVAGRLSQLLREIIRGL
jgi:purine-nucleoside phosphorylase